MTKKDCLKDLGLIKYVFDKLGVKFFLAYGTALGAYRDKDFLPEDDDIDIGVIDKLTLEQRKKIGTELIALGFKEQDILFNVFGTWEKNEPYYQGTEKSGIIVVERYVKITIFFFYDDGKEMVCIPRIGANPLISSPNKFYKELEEIEFYKVKYLVPSPVKEYLDWTYEEWKNKKKRDHGKLYNETH